MKKALKFIFASAIVMSMTACSGGGTPEAVAEQYLKHLAKGDFDKAAKLGTDDTKQLLGMLKGLMGGVTPEGEQEVKDIKCDVDGETAVCTYCCNDQGESDKLDLKQVNGKWLVDMKKETPSFDDADFDMNFDDSFSNEEAGDIQVEEVE